MIVYIKLVRIKAKMQKIVKISGNLQKSFLCKITGMGIK